MWGVLQTSGELNELCPSSVMHCRELEKLARELEEKRHQQELERLREEEEMKKKSKRYKKDAGKDDKKGQQGKQVSQQEAHSLGSTKQLGVPALVRDRQDSSGRAKSMQSVDMFPSGRTGALWVTASFWGAENEL